MRKRRKEAGGGKGRNHEQMEEIAVIQKRNGGNLDQGG